MASMTIEGTRFHQGLIRLMDLEDGKYLLGDSQNPPSPPKDFDMSKFHRGRLFFHEHIFCCSIAMFFSLVIGLSFPELLETLVFTQNSITPKKAFKRYIGTFRHIALWHYGDVWENGSDANKSILSVREMHRQVAQSMKMQRTKHDNHKFLSQYDMGVVQSGFMGFAVMYAYQIGIKCSALDVDDYVYFWYGIGHLLGIEKKYNICAHGTSQAYLFCKDIEDILINNMQTPPPGFKTMALTVIKAFQKSPNFTLISLPVITKLSYEAMSRKCKPLSFSDYVRFYLWKSIFFLNRHFKCVRDFLRIGTEKAFNLTFTPVVQNCG